MHYSNVCSKREMKKKHIINMRTRIVVVSSVAILLMTAIYIAYPPDRHPVIPAFDTDAWTRPYRGTLRIKSLDDGTRDFLLMNIGSDSRFLLEERPLTPAKRLVDGRSIYRYVVAKGNFIEISPEIWDAATGELFSCGMQERLYNQDTFTHDLITKILQFNGNVVPTAGPTVLKALPDPTKTYVAVLSAEVKVRGSLIPFADPTIKGDRYHQLFRMSDASEVGKPLKLKIKTDRDYISPCWSPDGRFLVYHDASEHLWIIDVSETLSADETN
jgi:hypothetical protein